MQKPDQVLVPVPADPTAKWLVKWQLHCPKCGVAEIDSANYAADHEVVTIQPDRDDYDGPLGTRGGYVQVDLQCSEGHSFAFMIANHKGAEFIGLV